MSNQTSAKAVAIALRDEIAEAAMDGDLLRGGKRIAKFNYGSDEKEDVKLLYAEAPRLPIFQEIRGGPLLAFKSKLRAHYEALSATSPNRRLEPSGERKERSGLFATANRHGLEIETAPPPTAIGACVNYKGEWWVNMEEFFHCS